MTECERCEGTGERVTVNGYVPCEFCEGERRDR